MNILHAWVRKVGTIYRKFQCCFLIAITKLLEGNFEGSTRTRLQILGSGLLGKCPGAGEVVCLITKSNSSRYLELLLIEIVLGYVLWMLYYKLQFACIHFRKLRYCFYFKLNLHYVHIYFVIFILHLYMYK